MKILKSIISTILILIIILIILLNILSITDNYLFGYRTYKVATASMEPTIKQGSIILIKKEKDYKVSDIVTYRGEDALITHRIIDINKNIVTTKGDRNNASDKTFEKDKIIGKVVYTLDFGFVIYLLKKPLSWIILISIIALIILYRK